MPKYEYILTIKLSGTGSTSDEAQEALEQHVIEVLDNTEIYIQREQDDDELEVGVEVMAFQRIPK